MALFYMDLETARALVASTLKLVEEGGDWDRRNRLKVSLKGFGGRPNG